ncbi:MULTISPECIES: hypothetical protein [Rahnella]|uniref:Uncharacterized protein n=1 Tax=Rahnella laticis TaxID=2787622 RepID=A0ABS0E271_9GAMM|nr:MULTISPECIES: hypothetical protein [Rahnella]MBF7979187.1 hypothetical protein [Rahnella laticis]MBF7999548.1 hypothetical protein [Rahnella sp. LAC-M12]
MLQGNVTDNPYFTLGSAGLVREIERGGKVSPLFVNFSRTNIAALLPTRFISALGHLQDVVLIADVHLYPLAMCYHQHIGTILGVFKSDTPLQMMVSRLRRLGNGEKMNLSPLAKKAAISYREAVLLEQSLEGIPFTLLTLYYHRDAKTLYRWRKNIARKLGVRQLHYLAMASA